MLKDACSLEHAMAVGLDQGIDDIKNLKGGLISFATDLANVTHKALNELEDKAKEAEKEVEEGAKQGLKDIENAGKTAGKDIEHAGKKALNGIEHAGNAKNSASECGGM